MGTGYKPQPTGLSKLAAKIRDLQSQLDALRTAANIQNSAITSGTGLTVQAPDGQAIQLLVSSDGESRELFYPQTAFQVQDWAAAVAFNTDASYGGGTLFLSSPAAPVSRITNQPAQVGEIDLASGDGVSTSASVSLSTSSIGLRLVDPIFGNPANITLGQPGTASRVEEDGTSWRLFGSDASLIFPNGTSEVRVRDVNNAAYTVIRASAFTVTSTREAKQDIQDLEWSAADTVANAPAQKWRYREEHADPTRVHFGPMAEDLPDELVDHGDPDVPGINTADLLGVAWAAIGEQQALIKDLTKRVADLEARLA